MQAGDLPAALRLTQTENWSHRLEDWEFHYRLGRGWVACNAEGTLLGTILWWPYGEAFGTVGLVVVDRQQQGKGIGRQLMEVVLNEAGNRHLQLVATQAGLKLYQYCGFREQGGIEQRQGMPVLKPVAAPRGVNLRAVTRDDFRALCELDAKTLGANRGEVINAILDVGTGVLAEQKGQLAGFALKRSSGRGQVIGPVIAGDQTLAMALISHHLNASAGFMRVDVPASATELSACLDAMGLVRVDRVTLMLRGDAHTGHAAEIYGLASQALG